jgi:tetratricopeptide (TPR) repeat protein
VAALALGDPSAAARDFREVIEAAPLLAAAHYNLACALAKGNEPAHALDALERAVELGQPAGAALRADSDLATLHGQARFEALAKGE